MSHLVSADVSSSGSDNFDTNFSIIDADSTDVQEMKQLLTRNFLRESSFLGPRTDKPPKTNKYGFEYAEHNFLGDTIYLTQPDGSKIVAADWKFALPNGLKLTYGQINGLAGDFYGTNEPISDGDAPADRALRFENAFGTLAKETRRTPKEALNILNILQKEVDAVNKAIEEHKDPWDSAYPYLDDMNIKLQIATIGRPAPGLSYLRLAQINWDHFGKDAWTAYNVGHHAALDIAAAGPGDNVQLEAAYAMNAFADHFLEDSFAAGHMRTPRRALHGKYDVTADACAKCMHDEDNAIGLNVQNPKQQSFKAFGDKRLLSPDDSTNLAACTSAVSASAHEIYDAWHTGQVPAAYAAWQFAPTLASALDVEAQELKPLFVDGQVIGRRSNVLDRTDPNLTTDYQYWRTALECLTSGRWKYPQPRMSP